MRSSSFLIKNGMSGLLHEDWNGGPLEPCTVYIIIYCTFRTCNITHVMLVEQYRTSVHMHASARNQAKSACANVKSVQTTAFSRVVFQVS